MAFDTSYYQTIGGNALQVAAGGSVTKGTAAALAATVIANGSMGYATDTNELKIGDGVNVFPALPSINYKGPVLFGRQTAAQLATYVGQAGEATTSSDGVAVQIGDGVTAGGRFTLKAYRTIKSQQLLTNTTVYPSTDVTNLTGGPSGAAATVTLGNGYEDQQVHTLRVFIGSGTLLPNPLTVAGRVFSFTNPGVFTPTSGQPASIHPLIGTQNVSYFEIVCKWSATGNAWVVQSGNYVLGPSQSQAAISNAGGVALGNGSFASGLQIAAGNGSFGCGAYATANLLSGALNQFPATHGDRSAVFNLASTGPFGGALATTITGAGPTFTAAGIKSSVILATYLDPRKLLGVNSGICLWTGNASDPPITGKVTAVNVPTLAGATISFTVDGTPTAAQVTACTLMYVRTLGQNTTAVGAASPLGRGELAVSSSPQGFDNYGGSSDFRIATLIAQSTTVAAAELLIQDLDVTSTPAVAVANDVPGLGNRIVFPLEGDYSISLWLNGRRTDATAGSYERRVAFSLTNRAGVLSIARPVTDEIAAYSSGTIGTPALNISVTGKQLVVSVTPGVAAATQWTSRLHILNNSYDVN